MFVLVLISLVLIFLIFKISDQGLEEAIAAFIKSVLVISMMLVMITEMLSLFGLINSLAITVCWSVVTLGAFIAVFRKKDPLHLARLKSATRQLLTNLFHGKLQKFVVLLTLASLIAVLVQGWLYPPNNWDSMTYHLARIEHWIQQGSVSHYPTHIYRQIYQPPFAEFALMHLELLSGSNRLLFLLQYFCALSTALVSLGMAMQLSLSKLSRLMLLIWILSLPMLLMQSSSTQNDLVLTFFVVSALYFVIAFIRTGRAVDLLFLGLAVGLAMLTKGTAYIMLFPVLILVGIAFFRKMSRTFNKGVFTGALAAVFLVLVINSGHFTRNFKLTDHVLGTPKEVTAKYRNAEMNTGFLVSNALKNAGLHIGPYPLNAYSYEAIKQIHKWMGVDMRARTVNFGRTKFLGAPPMSTGESRAPNPFHFYLGLIAIMVLVLRLVSKKATPSGMESWSALILGVLLVQSLLFCYLLKWQPWHSRLHLPMFMLLGLFTVCVADSSRLFKRILWYGLPVLTLYALVNVPFNTARPIVSIGEDNYGLNTPFEQRYLPGSVKLWNEQEVVLNILEERGVDNLGLYVGSDFREYPLIRTLSEMDIEYHHIDVANVSAKTGIKQAYPGFIITTDPAHRDQLLSRGFGDLTSGNSQMWLLLKQ